MKHRVFVVGCHDYESVELKISELLDMMGGIEQFVSAKETIILKPNLLSVAKPEKAVSTHPSVVAAVGKIVKKIGAKVIIADSPGSGLPNTKKIYKRLYETNGMSQAAEEAGIELNWDTSFQNVSFPKGKLIKRFEVITPATKADGIINLCKLKTHSFMAMTGAVKNTFGVICGYSKPGYHAKLQDTARFAGMLLDLANFLSPRFSIMDAVIGMEGNGPHGGPAKPVGLLLGSTDPLALDVVAGEIMGLPRENNPVLIEAERRGQTPTRIEEIDLKGIESTNLRVPDFRLPKTFLTGSGFGKMPRFVSRVAETLFKKGATLKPEIQKDRCTACGQCQRACPMQVISIHDGKYAEIHYKECIRCYCCHEMCPEHAIELRSGFLYRLLSPGQRVDPANQ